MSAFVHSVVTREKPLHEVNPALASQHSDLNHRFFVLYDSDGHGKTIEYGHFDGTDNGKIRIHDHAQTIHAMLEAHEFDVRPEKGYEWAKFHHWILNKSGYDNTPWTRDHHSITFIDDCLDHLSKHASRPEEVEVLSANAKLDNLQDPTDEAVHVFDAVKKDVVHEFHKLHKRDQTHHTHVMDEAAHMTNYKLVQFGTRSVAYGTIFLGKVDIGNGHFLHVRVHKFHPGSPKEVEFHSIRTTRDSGIWAENAVLVRMPDLLN